MISSNTIVISLNLSCLLIGAVMVSNEITDVTFLSKNISKLRGELLLKILLFELAGWQPFFLAEIERERGCRLVKFSLIHREGRPFEIGCVG